MRKAFSIFFVIMGCSQMVLDTIAYNQLSAEETSVYKYHLWIVLFSLPLLALETFINSQWKTNRPLRIYSLFVVSILILLLFHQVLYTQTASFDLVRTGHILYPFFFVSYVYNISSKRILSVKLLSNLAFFVWIVFVLIFINGWTDVNVTFDMDSRGRNNIYYVLCALPFCQHNENRKIRFLTLAITGVLCLLSLKRGAIIAYMAAAFFFSVWGAKANLIRKRIPIIVLTVLALVFLYNYFDNISGGYISFRFKMEDTRDTGRNDIYEGVYNALSKSSTKEIVFGHGMDAVRNTNEYQLTAHNDYLEIIYDYGIIPFILWIFFFINILRLGILTLKKNERRGAVLLGSCCIFIVISMVSHFFFASYSCALLLYWGVAFNKKNLLPQ